MSPEQFVYWLSGYLTGGTENDPNVVINDIKKALSTVKVTQYSGDIVACFTGDSP